MNYERDINTAKAEFIEFINRHIDSALEGNSIETRILSWESSITLTTLRISSETSDFRQTVKAEMSIPRKETK